jgi:hypothetical protein
MGTYLVDLRQLLNLWSMQDPESQAHHLQVFAAGRRRDISWLCPNIVDNTLLQPWDQKVRALVHNCILHSRQPIEDHSSSATLHIVNRSLDEGGADSKRNGVFVQ